jgi:transcriptional regulator with XRE-family HTH domain
MPTLTFPASERRRLQLARQAKGITYAALAQQIGVTSQYVEGLMNGRIEAPRYKTVVLDAIRAILLTNGDSPPVERTEK